MSSLQELLARAVANSESSTPPRSSKKALFMPSVYVSLRSGGLSTDDGVPEKIEGAVAPHSLIAIPGRLVKVHLENADIRYMSGLYSGDECRNFLRILQDHKNCSSPDWVRFGKSGRSVAQWSRPGGIKYTFSDVEYIASPLPGFVESIRQEVIRILRPIYGDLQTEFNYCVANCYANGLSGVNWHSDAEPHLVPGCPIACVSFGSERVFSLAKLPRSVTESPKSDLNVRLESGSLIVMAGDTQQHYLHAISKESSVREPRFSLTFRVNYHR